VAARLGRHRRARIVAVAVLLGATGACASIEGITPITGAGDAGDDGTAASSGTSSSGGASDATTAKSSSSTGGSGSSSSTGSGSGSGAHGSSTGSSGSSGASGSSGGHGSSSGISSGSGSSTSGGNSSASSGGGGSSGSSSGAGCTAATCDAGSVCVSGSCQACGAASEPCCTGATACQATLSCAGVGCTCLVPSCSGQSVLRSDGTVWTTGQMPPVEMMASSSTPFVATSFDAEFGSYGSGGLICAIDDSGSGYVWCSGVGYYGSLGNGTSGNTAQTATAVQVVTSVGPPATPLSGIKQVVVDGSTSFVVCAVDGSGSVWCWGDNSYGELGNGGTSGSAVATPVLTGSGGPQFTGVASLSVVQDHACAVKTDGTVWCWGHNDLGQVGQPTSTLYYLYPTQITALGTRGAQVSVGTEISCLLDTDGGVWCWGGNSAGAVGIGTTTSANGGTVSVPSQVQTTAATDGGAPPSYLTGISVVRVNPFGNASACALMTSNRALYCWGSGYEFPLGTAQLYGESSESGVYALCDNAGTEPAFIDANGQMHDNGALVASAGQVTCP
jgi:alpha-tubulin suppressor-like RCC1 family protein